MYMYVTANKNDVVMQMCYNQAKYASTVKSAYSKCTKEVAHMYINF